MSTLAVTENYSDGNTLTFAQLTAMTTSIETWANGNIGSDNIASGGIAESNLAASSVSEAKIASSAVSTAKIADASITLAKLASEITAKLIPSGAMVMYGGTSAPTGWLMCDGTAVSRTTYASLFTAIGIAHGYGDNSTTFNLPDARGRFPRGVDSSQGRDPDSASRGAMNTGGNTGDAVGSIQGDQFTAHSHTSPVFNTAESAGTTNIRAGGNSNTSSVSTSAAGGNETRPVNFGTNFIIKT